MKLINGAVIKSCWECKYLYEQEKPDFPVYKIICNKTNKELKNPFTTIDPSCELQDVEVIDTKDKLVTLIVNTRDVLAGRDDIDQIIIVRKRR